MNEHSMRFGDTEVARIGLGTNRLAKTRGGVELIKATVAAGVQMLDTAHTYTGGQSEETIGEGLAPIPGDCIVATKGGLGSGRPQALRDEIEMSLPRLRTDSIPLYYLHRVDPAIPLEESIAAIKEYLDRGKIRHIGLSNVDIDQIERARKVVSIAAVQNAYSLSLRKYDTVVDYCAAEEIVFVPYVPLRGADGAAVAEIASRAPGYSTADRSRVAAAAVAGDLADPRHAVAAASQGKPRRVEHRALRRRVRSPSLKRRRALVTVHLPDGPRR